MIAFVKFLRCRHDAWQVLPDPWRIHLTKWRIGCGYPLLELSRNRRLTSKFLLAWCTVPLNLEDSRSPFCILLITGIPSTVYFVIRKLSRGWGGGAGGEGETHSHTSIQGVFGKHFENSIYRVYQKKLDKSKIITKIRINLSFGKIFDVRVI